MLYNLDFTIVKYAMVTNSILEHFYSGPSKMTKQLFPIIRNLAKSRVS